MATTLYSPSWRGHFLLPSLRHQVSRTMPVSVTISRKALLRRWQRLARKVLRFMVLCAKIVSLEGIWDRSPMMFNRLNDRQEGALMPDRPARFSKEASTCRHQIGEAIRVSSNKHGKFKECLLCGSRWILCEPGTKKETWAQLPNRPAPARSAPKTPEQLAVCARPSTDPCSSAAASSAPPSGSKPGRAAGSKAPRRKKRIAQGGTAQVGTDAVMEGFAQLSDAVTVDSPALTDSSADQEQL